MQVDQRVNPTEIDPNFKKRITYQGKVVSVDAAGLYFKDLNSILRALVQGGDIEKIEVHNVCGQRYIGTNLNVNLQIDVHGTPGNDLAAFLNGPKIIIHGNAQDASGNTMNEGEIVVHGHAGDLTGHSMRGGRIFVKDYVGYRVGIHMKQYEHKVPTIVIGETAGDFLAEYMAGGVICVLGLNLKEGEKCNSRFVGTGMHGGIIYERGEIFTPEAGTKVEPTGKRDLQAITKLVNDYVDYFGGDAKTILSAKFYKISPISTRPYEKLYSH